MKARKIRIGIVSLGCPKTLVDSEIVLGKLKDPRYALAGNVDESDVVLVNTCGFIRDAKDESIDVILRLIEYRRTGRIRALVVMGCLVQRYAAELAGNFPEVDAFLGSGDYNRITAILRSVGEGERSVILGHPGYLGKAREERIPLTPRYSRYLKISEGCDHTCSFCVIPKIRGKFRSRSIPDVVREACALVRTGAKELILIGQDITKFGCDYARKPLLPELLDALEPIPGLEWIRLLYAYPNSLNARMIAKIAGSGKICHYLDLPLQHISDKILTAMRRGGGRHRTVELIKKLRGEIPDLALRTSFIVGFPGETERDFGELLDFMAWAKFERAGVFRYSREEGSAAAAFPAQVSERVKDLRFHKAMSLQKKVAKNVSRRQTGRELRVLIEGKLAGGNLWKGRSYMDAPEIDPHVIVESSRPLKTGAFYPVMITGAKGYDLVGKI